MIQHLIFPLSQPSVLLCLDMPRLLNPLRGNSYLSCPDCSVGCSWQKPCQIDRIIITSQSNLNSRLDAVVDLYKLGVDFDLCWSQVKIMLLFLGPQNTNY